jgi:hypothetical protein
MHRHITDNLVSKRLEPFNNKFQELLFQQCIVILPIILFRNVWSHSTRNSSNYCSNNASSYPRKLCGRNVRYCLSEDTASHCRRLQSSELLSFAGWTESVKLSRWKALSSRQGLEVAEMVKIQTSYLEVWHPCGIGCCWGWSRFPLFFSG